MLCLLFYVGKTKFVVDTSYVEEIIPNIHVADPSPAHSIYKGLINYRGELFPLLDFCKHYSGNPTENKMNSRIIILNSLDNRKMGLLAEYVVETMTIDKSWFIENPMDVEECTYISGLWSTPDGVVKNLDVPLLFHICYEDAKT